MNPNGVNFENKEFPFTDTDFRFIQDLVADRTGIVLSDIKRTMVYSRIARRIRQCGVSDFAEYCDLLKAGDESELVSFTNAITTNLTSFFREPHHFEYLAKTVLPELERTKKNKRIRIWSAGCSSGEEPYSIAMTVLDHFKNKSGWDIKILASDLDYEMVERASKGVYKEERVTGLDKKHLRNYVKKGKGKAEGMVKMDQSLIDMITFKQLNLLHEWPFNGPFDFMFCRNVVIYFNKETQKELFDRYAELLPESAPLFIGHSESLFKVTDRFKSLGQTIYRKVK
ncbi:MAG: chemotaxis protein CheR [endosymbiont of Galathealinum brachiosum]|uniref:Chemotaxis protein methyltransferase n=1 Tax=endosymbiont of Galathealinum brachiosum TaxID=2200906 RepID=A0A370DJF0_9GAMM|nr:MAG: chemotaxis protein CheR [endosymbiont of Galathealinum brachiosum]